MVKSSLGQRVFGHGVVPARQIGEEGKHLLKNKYINNGFYLRLGTQAAIESRTYKETNSNGKRSCALSLVPPSSPNFHSCLLAVVRS